MISPSLIFLPLISIWIDLAPGHSGSQWQTIHIELSLRVRDERKVLFAWRPQDLLDLADLVQVVLAGEERLIVDHLSEDTADTPDVESLGVTLQQSVVRQGRTHRSHHITLALSMTSGALYQRVATYSVRTPVWSWLVSQTLASPKSQI